eukprot:TRINITY_DN5284_c0_g1_i1.p1 TRINITY_DN5284_c0_g1~~TRINITY_DN5284_c0_g1_i1.p1  ORF type:complete len:317 (-),score=51.18 TRINITY_DN5284_c0_g1_i1:7-957(-)
MSFFLKFCREMSSLLLTSKILSTGAVRENIAIARAAGQFVNGAVSVLMVTAGVLGSGGIALVGILPLLLFHAAKGTLAQLVDHLFSKRDKKTGQDKHKAKTEMAPLVSDIEQLCEMVGALLVERYQQQIVRLKYEDDVETVATHAATIAVELIPHLQNKPSETESLATWAECIDDAFVVQTEMCKKVSQKELATSYEKKWSSPDLFYQCGIVDRRTGRIFTSKTCKIRYRACYGSKKNAEERGMTATAETVNSNHYHQVTLWQRNEAAQRESAGRLAHEFGSQQIQALRQEVQELKGELQEVKGQLRQAKQPHRAA